MERKMLFDNGGRRLRADRRKFSYAVHIPERRSGIDRRNGLDRRGNQRDDINYIINIEDEQDQSV